jgi:DNA gyrase subunit A
LEQLKELQKEIDRLELILSSIINVFAEARKEFIELQEKYGDKRKTKVINARPGEFTDEQLIENKETYIILTEKGYIKQLPKSAFKVQHRGGKGISAIKTNDDDQVLKMEYCQTHDNLLFFTSRGRVFELRGWDVPEASRQSKGKAIINLLNLEADEKVTTFFAIDPQNMDRLQNSYVFFTTEKGTVKKTTLGDYQNIRTSGLIAIKLSPGDQLVNVEIVSKDDFIFIVSIGGKAITFNQLGVRSMGRSAQGVRGIRLRPKEIVSSTSIVPKADMNSKKILIVTEKGFGKLVKASSFRTQNRGGMGIKAANIGPKTGQIVFSALVAEENAELVLSSATGQTVKLQLANLPVLSRNAQGVIIMRFSSQKDYIVSATLLQPE